MNDAKRNFLETGDDEYAHQFLKSIN